MSKGWPDPFHDRGDDFWNFDNMVSEYEWEQQRKARQRQRMAQSQNEYVIEIRERTDNIIDIRKANKAHIELLLLDTDSYEENAEVFFKVISNFAFPIECFEIWFHVCDRGGRVINDGIASDYNVLTPGAITVISHSVWPENGFSKEDISGIQVYAYEYTADGYSYRVDFENGYARINEVTDSAKKVGFGSADIIGFDAVRQECDNGYSVDYDNEYNDDYDDDYNDEYDDDYDDEEYLDVTYNVTNRSGADIDSISFTVCFYDKAGMCIGQCYGHVDELSSGSSEETECTFFKEYDFQDVASYRVVKYDYMLKTPDRSGCRHFIVDKVLRSAKGE